MSDYRKFYRGIKRLNSDCYKWDKAIKDYHDDKLLPFSLADSDYEAPKKVKKALIKRAHQGHFGYTYYSDELYQAIISWCKKRYQYDISKDNIVITLGVVNALHNLIQTFTNPNDHILINTPVYNPFYDVITNNKRIIKESKLIRQELDDNLFTYELDFSDLEEKIKDSKMYILCNPHNPVGRVWTYKEIEKIVLLCKKYNCILVSDEIHGDLIMPNITFTSALRFSHLFDKIICCIAPSKTFNVAGLGTASTLFSTTNMAETFRKQYEMQALSSNMFGLIACLNAYIDGTKYVDIQNQYIKENQEIVYNFISKHHLKMAKLEGTYLIWIDLSNLKLDEEAITLGLLKHHILINKGSLYSSSLDGTYIRMNIACSRKALLKGLKYFEEFLNEQETGILNE